MKLIRHLITALHFGMYMLTALYVITYAMPDAAFFYKVGICYTLAHVYDLGRR